jgi:hypothetical protein
VHQVCGWYTGAATHIGWMRETKWKDTSCEGPEFRVQIGVSANRLALCNYRCFLYRINSQMVLKHLIFEVVQQTDGNWTAAGIADDIFTQGSDFEDLKVNAVEAIRAHFFDEECDKFEVCFAQVVSQFVFAA